MKKTEKKKLLTKSRIAIGLALLFVLSLATAIILYFTVWSREEEAPKKEPPVALEHLGEAVVNGSLMAYPVMEESKIQDIVVQYQNKDGKSVKYGMSRPDKNGSFILYYEDENGKLTEFRPDICEEDDDFLYSYLYSVEKDDGFGAVTKLKYLCMALMYTYVEERIELIPAEKEAQLDAYGLAEGEYETIVFTYLDVNDLDENGEPKKKEHYIQIGDATTLGTGYYIRVDNRNYVYASYQNYFSYALAGFHSFVNPIVISPGIAEDTVIGAYLTTNYRQWINEMHKEGASSEDSRVIVFADEIIPVQRPNSEEEKEKEKPVPGGYNKSGYKEFEFDLAKYKGKDGYERLLSALTGKAVGDYSANQIIFTVSGTGAKIEFGEAASLLYEYGITEIESIITDAGEITAKGTAVGANNLVKLAYRLKIGGKDASVNVLHSVIDLSEAGLPEDFVSAVRASSIGPVSINATINYSADNSVRQTVKYVITELVSVFDQSYKEISKVAEDSIITYKYRFDVNGKAGEEEYLATLDLSKDNGEAATKIKSVLKGKAPAKDIDAIADEYVEYCEYFEDFYTYSVSKIEYFVTKELISAFKFQNSSERDPFYGESIYENTLPEDHKYKIYGLNNGVCQRIVNILTGISENASSAPNGLIGTETVAVGLTPEVMRDYYLYDYTIEFALPRGIYALDSGDADVGDDYAWYDVLNFTLYISEEQPDGTRFVASDLYDIVVKIDAKYLVFLKYDFVNFFARREMMLTDVTDIYEATFELNFDNDFGRYEMEILHRDVYWGSDQKRYPDKNKMPSNVTVQSTFDEIHVSVTPKGECSDNALIGYIEAHGYESGSLTTLYKEVADGGKDVYLGYDPHATSNFKKLLGVIYSTGYSGIVSEAEQTEILASSEMLFRMSYKIGQKPYRYVYEYYRFDDQRVLVKLYKAIYDENSNTYTQIGGAVSDFYISNFAFRKIVKNFVNLLDVKDIDREVGYPE